MPIILLETTIKADINRCFDLSRSIELHVLSTKGTHEEAIGGITHGLIGLNESVTWRATHFGVRQRLTSRITLMERPRYFRDEQLKGAVKRLIHDHYFRQEGDYTVMEDRFFFESPLGILGKIVNRVVLTGYLRAFLIERNHIIKQFGEGGEEALDVRHDKD